MALVIACLLPSQVVRAQEDGAPEVQIEAKSIGVGGVLRPGDWGGVRLVITDTAERPREVLIRVTLRDADGDRVMYETNLATNPGVPLSHWTYLYLPARFRAKDAMSVQAFAAIEQTGSGASQATYTAGRLLGSGFIVPQNVGDRTRGLIGIVGRFPMGLTKYAGFPPNIAGLPGSHEASDIVNRLDADAMPDRWMGLASFDTIVWNEPAPGSLGTARAAALREWVQRGGHLVVVLPRVGQTWTDEANNPLYDVTPRVRVARREGVDLEAYRLLVTRDPNLAMPTSETLQVLTPAPEAAPDEAIPILVGPQREAIVVRRLVGSGVVTLVGLDVASRWMSEHGLPEPELFWHRVLGRRGELYQPKAGETTFSVNDRDPVTLDRDVGDQIAKAGRAEAGVFAGLIVFVAYWLFAGPLGFAVLKRTKRSQHAWVAFVLATGVFTTIAWGGAMLIRPQRIEASHLTIMDHVYGQPTERMRSWVSVLIPSYGRATLSFNDPAQPGLNSRFTNMIAPWEPEGGSSSAFPDASGYKVDARAPDHVTVPTRGTVKQFQLDWAGGAAWKMPRPIATPGAPSDGAPPRLWIEEQAGERSNISTKVKIPVRGTLVHDLPAPLHDVVIIVNRGQRHVAGALASGGPLLADFGAWRLSDPWKPGVPLDLASPDIGGASAEATDPVAYMSRLLLNDVGAAESLMAPDSDPNRMTARQIALAFMPQLQPPGRPGDFSGPRDRIAVRKNTHGWDLGVWFTQPSIMIVGQLGSREEGPGMPTPMFVSTGGAFRALPSSGRTVVRWVYPLSSDPPRVTAREAPPREPGS
jgi:hypothetical protein